MTPCTAHSIPIVWQDNDLLVVNKPSGLLTVPGRGPEKQDCLINRLLVDFPNSRIVHRLDQPTSGLVLIPQNHHAHKTLGRQFETRTISKQYIAVVDGCLKLDSGEIDLPLICDWPNRPRQMVDHENGKNALTRYQVLDRCEAKGNTRLALTPVTGRSHQLRVHMLALGHPILGDTLYAPEPVIARASRLQLHARHIEFTHPVSDEKIFVTCEPSF
ncbi:RNA pseudouridine synthase [Gilvimarinus agarilyticus]|uniref:RluA family pseudouridine synthase n=1 Tax=Gilvimarinus sp. 2_MG-2023 TaxID=3062666 RepID=UPI001C097E71|nr:pseudouridine synthase [Gilvimarinus sp. 2_MG-2023]MBU2884148.1 RNA pseudouridine synthase [Gilvimarinus agarilyticus]MDO6569320.1 pseudouridine synthase [Gilvimarinus sp. 2_MG-2023]